MRKVKDYLRAGTKYVWAVYADERTVTVFHLEAGSSLRGCEYGVNDTLDGGDAGRLTKLAFRGDPDVLPGFSLPVRDIFPK